ncbi:MAG: hypothetical protein VB101_01785 [Rhodospirillaceae bacterium]|nr:hypothetical protein [Rhodospirillaceae bacterium]
MDGWIRTRLRRLGSSGRLGATERDADPEPDPARPPDESGAGVLADERGEQAASRPAAAPAHTQATRRHVPS